MPKNCDLPLLLSTVSGKSRGLISSALNNTLWLLLFWLAGGLVPAGAEGVLKYAVADSRWPVIGLGNERVRLVVSNNAEVVWAHVPWRRRDVDPKQIGVVLMDVATGLKVTNAISVNISRESGDLLFQPPTVPGEYFLYYLPFQSLGNWYSPTIQYLAPTNTASSAWSASCAPAIEQLKAGKPAGVPIAQVLELQAIDDFHRFDPMEISATAEEMKQFLSVQSGQPYLLFPEDRRYPIRMTDELPLRWVQAGPGDSFKGEACQGEFYVFQIGLYASKQAIEDVTVTFGDLVRRAGARIPATALRCFNLGGTNSLGQPFHKTVNVPEGKVQAFWLGVAVPREAAAQTYLGMVTVAAKNAPARTVALQLTVTNRVLTDAGDSEIWRQSRLRWLDSAIGLDDEVFPPYTPVEVRDRTVAVLGRDVHFNDTGLLDSIRSTFSRNVDAVGALPHELLAAPMKWVVETPSGRLNWTGTTPQILSQTSGAVIWEARSAAGQLRLDCWAKMECDGYVNFKLTLRADQATELKDVHLEIPIRKEEAICMMGMGRKGGYRPSSWQWKWDPARENNQLWIGDINAGLRCNLKTPFEDWSNGGLGGCNVEEKGDQVVFHAYTGVRQISAGQELHFNFGLLITPLKVLDKRHWDWRYFHHTSNSPIAEIAKTGATIVNLHQGDPLNPYINYPFLTVDNLSAYTREAHAQGMKVKIYYTVRELSDYTVEFWALRSLGNEVFADGSGGFHLTDEIGHKKSGSLLVPTGDSWLCEHVISGYSPAWHNPLDNGRVDAAIVTSGQSRWNNYYLEGLNWLIQNVGIDGLYLDGIGYDRETMKRVRKVMQRSGRDCLIDYHDGNEFLPEYGMNSPANRHMEHMPCIDSLWFGEGFNYNEPPDYWLVEMAGIPYGLFSEMLEGGGNPWRGMLFGMTSRLGWGGNPQPIWKVWDEFGIQDAKMIGFWDTNCPVQTGLKDVLATAYVKNGKALIAVASWATNVITLRLQIDGRTMGIDSTNMDLYAPPINGFQPEAHFKLGDNIAVAVKKGWLLLAVPHHQSITRHP